MHKDMRETIAECMANEIPVVVGDEWVAFGEDGKVLRRLRILALHPDVDNYTIRSGGRMWIYQELPAALRTQSGRLGIIPEFNLRYVMQKDEDAGH